MIRDMFILDTELNREFQIPSVAFDLDGVSGEKPGQLERSCGHQQSAWGLY